MSVPKRLRCIEAKDAPFTVGKVYPVKQAYRRRHLDVVSNSGTTWTTTRMPSGEHAAVDPYDHLTVGKYARFEPASWRGRRKA